MVKEPKGVPVVKAAVEKIKVRLIFPQSHLLADLTTVTTCNHDYHARGLQTLIGCI